MVTAPSYGKWCDRKLWTVHESICLLLSIEPETPGLRDRYDVGGFDPLSEAFEQYGELAVEAMESDALKPFSPTDLWRPPLERRVDPRTFLEWARSRGISIPDELGPVLARPPVQQPVPDASLFARLGYRDVKRGPDQSPEAREQVLGAALAALRSFPERCRDAASIRRTIEENAPLVWTDTRKPPLSSAEIERLIGQWLDRLG